MGDEGLAEGVDATPLDRQPRRGAMPAVTQQVGARRGQPAEQVERRDRAPGSCSLVAVEGDQDGGPVMALRDPRGHDADHAGMPAVRGEHVSRGARWALRDLLLGLEEDPRLHVAPLDVDRVELGRDDARPGDVGCQQQLEPRVRAMQAPGRVDPRGEPEPDRAGVHAARIHARHLHERLQAGLARGGQRAQTLADEAPVLTHQRDAVGHRGERDQVEVGVGLRAVQSRRLQQRAREKVAHAGRAQLRARIAAEQRMHDGRVGQAAVRSRRVVIRDHDVEPGGERRGHLVDGRDRAVDGHQQLGAAGRQPLDRRRREPVAVVDPAREIPVHLGAERAQRAHQHRGGAHPVHVVVAVDGDPRAALDVAEYPLGALAQPAERVERMAHLRSQESAGGRRIGEPPADQHLGGHVRDPQLAAQPRGGRVVVRAEVQADVGPGHAAHRTGRTGRKSA
jgi:hypothetical protein